MAQECGSVKGHAKVMHVIEIDVVRDRIFSFLSLQDLLSCSLVSLDWCKAARSFIRKSRVCCIKITGGQLPCEQLLTVANLLRKSPPTVPALFNGIHVGDVGLLERSMQGEDCKMIREDITAVITYLSGKIDLKYLTLPEDWILCGDGFLMVEELLRLKSEELRFLEVEHIREFLDLLEEEVENSSEAQLVFKNLRTLKSTCGISVDFLEEGKEAESFALMFKATPNLEALYGQLSPTVLRFFPEDKMVIVKDLCIDFNEAIRRLNLNTALEICEQLASKKPKLEQIVVETLWNLHVCVSGLEFNVNFEHVQQVTPTLLEILNRLLESSSSSLRMLQLPLRLLLHRNLVLPEKLDKVETLKLDCNEFENEKYSDPIPLPLFFLRHFNLAPHFPYLRRVELLDMFGQAHEIVTFVLQRPGGGHNHFTAAPVTTVTELKVEVDFPGLLWTMKEMFPEVKRLEAMCWNFHDESGQLWFKSWPKLIALTLMDPIRDYIDFVGQWDFFSGRSVGHLDSVLCGLDGKECDELRKMGAGALRTLNIVRRRPNLTDLKELRELNLCFLGTPLTSLTEILTFERMPKVRVKQLTMEFPSDSSNEFESSLESSGSSLDSDFE